MKARQLIDSRVALALIVATVFATQGQIANAFDLPIRSTTAILKFAGDPPRGRIFKLLSKAGDQPHTLPAPGPGAPVSSGATLTVTLNGGELACNLAAGLFDGTRGWKALGTPPGTAGWKYLNKNAPSDDPCKLVLLKKRLIKVIAASTGGLDPPLGPAANSALTAMLRFSEDRYCARVAPGQYNRESENRTIKAKRQPEPISCEGSPCPDWTRALCDLNNDGVTRALCIGDSNAGMFLGRDPPVNWCERLNAWYARPNWEAVPCAHGGLQAAMCESWVADCLATHPADTVIFHLGTNDVFAALADDGVVSSEEVDAIIVAMAARADQAEAAGAFPLVTSLLTDEHPRVIEVDDGYAELFGWGFEPICADLVHPDDFQPDGYHINVEGHRKVACRLWRRLGDVETVPAECTF